MNTIEQIRQEHEALHNFPFPRSIYAYHAQHKGKAVMLAITYAEGGIQSYLKNEYLDTDRAEVLRGSARVIGESLDIEDAAGKDYLQRLHRVCLMVLSEINKVGDVKTTG